MHLHVLARGMQRAALEMPAVLLRAKSDFSYGTAAGSPSEIAAAAARAGVTALALADVASLAGQVEFHAACRAYGVRPVTGVELAVGAGSRCVLLAQRTDGYGNLCRIVTALRARATQPDVVATIGEHASGAFVLSDDARVLDALERLGVRPADMGLLVTVDGAGRAGGDVEVATKRGWLLVPDLEAVMPREADRPLFELKRRVFEHRRRSPPNGATGASLESLARTQLTPVLQKTAERLAERCEFDLLAIRRVAAGENDAPALHELARFCAARAPAGPESRDRLRRELSVIGEMRLASYFLQARAIADEAAQRGISIATRGSAVSSLVVHLLGLTPVDPVAQGLYFERFLRPSRTEPPDIDLDVASTRRDELVAAMMGRFGPDRVALVAAHQRFRRRSAYGEGLAALGLSRSGVERFGRHVRDEELELPLPLHLLPDELRARAPVIERLVDRPSHLSTHPSALLVLDVPVDGLLPLVLAPKGAVVTEYDGGALAHLGFPKLDLLGSRALAELDEIAELAGLREAPPLDDPATLATIGAARTVGCNQLETPAMRAVLCRLPVRRFDDVVAALALVRPAAGAREAKDAFIARARGEPAPPVDPVLASLLPGTHGLVLYEEDVIHVIASIAGVAPDRADAFREALVRGEDVGGRFAAAAAGRGVDEGTARRVWSELSRFAAYSFSKAHAISAALIAYRSAFAKTHHPAAFGCALLNHHGGAYPLRAIAAEIARCGVALLPPSVNASEAASTVERGAVRVGLGAIKHLTRATKARLFESRRRGGRFDTVADLERRVDLGRKEREALVMSGACDGLPPLCRDAYPFPHFAFLGVPARAAPVSSGSPESDRLRVYQTLVRIQNELALLGMHLVAHPLAVLRREAERAGCLTSEDLALRLGERVRFAGVVSAVHHVRRGRKVVTLVTFEDEQGVVEAVAVQSAADFRPSVDSPGPYLVEGKVRGHPGCIRLEIEAIRPFHRRDAPYAP